MSSPETVTVTLRGAPAQRRPWLGTLARLVLAAPPPAAVLIESSFDGLPVHLTVRPAGVVELLRRGFVGRGVECSVAPGGAPTPPRGLSGDRLGVLVRAGSRRSAAPAEDRADVDPVGTAVGLEDRSWLGLQTFWLPSPRGTLWLARRFRLAAPSGTEVGRGFGTLGIALAADWSRTTGIPSVVRPSRWGGRRDWGLGGLRSIPDDAWLEASPDVAGRTANAPETPTWPPTEPPVETPAIVLGASGAGKTTYLARWAARTVALGGALCVLDLHGDLAPAVLARLSPEARRRVVAVDASQRPVPGLAAVVTDGPRDRAAAHLVAALKRLSPDGTELYWGFRLERIFDTVVRLALESGGSLADMYDLLTNADRRDAARLATRSTEVARFLDELAPVVRRNPEFLWSAATRLSKVMLVPSLRELLSPDDGGLPVEEMIVRDHRTLLVRLPFASLGPEAAGFAATLVLGRVYFGVVAAAERSRVPTPVAIVLDEVQAFSPYLVAEIVTEGRKFGVRAVIASQYPDRLARGLASAARGALRGFVAFRVPRPAAVEVGRWLGLGPDEAAELLPTLATGSGFILDGLADGLRPARPEATIASSSPEAWEDALTSTREEFGVRADAIPEDAGPDEATERLLLAVLSGTESGAVVPRAAAVVAAMALPGGWVDPALLAHRLGTALQEGYLVDTDGGLRLTAAGERRVGLTVPTGASRESAEHRALLLATFRRFAARGYHLEILRQGRFDTTLPDARFRQLSVRDTARAPADLAVEIERRQGGWAWRFFRGRDVHVEAEVSGALRAERVRHGVAKALRREAFVLFVVGDAHRARRVRTVLRGMGLGVDRAQVWTLGLPPGSTLPTTR